MKKLTIWFNMNDHPRFPLITPAKVGKAIALHLDLDLLEFKEGELPPLTTKHFFDCQFNSETLNRPTPLWDSLLTIQIGPRSVCCECGFPAKFKQADYLYCGPCAADGVDELCELTQCDML